MATGEDYDSWKYYTKHLFKADDKRLFKNDDVKKEFYDGFATYSIMDNYYVEENAKDKFLLEREDKTFRQFFSDSSEFAKTILKGSMLIEARRLSVKTLRIICNSEIYPIYQSLATLVDDVKKLYEKEEEEACASEGFTVVLYKNGMAINFYAWDEDDPYWFERKASIFIQAPKSRKRAYPFFTNVNVTERPFLAQMEAVEPEPPPNED